MTSQPGPDQFRNSKMNTSDANDEQALSVLWNTAVQSQVENVPFDHIRAIIVIVSNPSEDIENR